MRSRGATRQNTNNKRKGGDDTNDSEDDNEEGKPLHPRVLPIQKSATQLTNLVTSLTKSMYGDEGAKTEAKQISDALIQREKEKRRYSAYMEARSEWKGMNTGQFISVLRMELDRQRILREKVEVFKKMLQNKKMQVFLQEWNAVMQLNLMARKDTIAKSMAMETRYVALSDGTER